MKVFFASILALLSVVATLTGAAQDLDGQISGVLVDAAGQPQAGQHVELWRAADKSLRFGRITDANGRFVYRGLDAGRYEIELRIDGRAVATSGTIELVDRAAQVNDVVVTPRRLPTTWSRTKRQVANLPRVTAKQVLGTQDVATTFEALQAILKPGHEIVFVKAHAAGETRGRIAEISSDRIVVVRNRFFGDQELVLTQDTLRKIEIVDPTTNGALIGLAIGGTVGAMLGYAAFREIEPYAYIFGISMTVIGIRLGAKIDRQINEPIYEALPQTRVTGGPLLGPKWIGLTMRVQF